MNSLFLHNFKAFKDDFSLNPNGDNVLLYGENGAGKSSLFEGLKLFYFQERLLRERIAPNIVGQARIDETKQVLDEYKYADNLAIKVSVDNVDFDSHDNINDSIFLVSYQNIAQTDVICIEDLVNNAYFSQKDNHLHWISDDFINMIIDCVNEDLEDCFWMEGVKVHSIDIHGRCSIENSQNKIPKSIELYKFFNESIIHVVKFIILIEAMGYFQNQILKPMLVLDDCFNSLDMPNRTFMMKFLLKKTVGIQKVVLTHNIGFYNLFIHIIQNVAKQENDWKFYQLAKIGEERILLDGSEDTTADIKQNMENDSAATVGNKLRQRFEILVYKLSSLNNIGELQETKDLLDKMCSPNAHIHLSKQGDVVKDIYTLVDEIYSNVTNGNEYKLAKRLKEKIDNFRKHDFMKLIKPSLVELRLLQKVALHPASHGHHGLPPISENEIDVSLVLLEKLENAIKSVSSREDVSSI